MERVERVGEKLFYRERKEVRVITGYHQQQKSKGVQTGEDCGPICISLEGEGDSPIKKELPSTITKGHPISSSSVLGTLDKGRSAWKSESQGIWVFSHERTINQSLR